jgi:uncharacterized membrane protein YeaQ/YmgE (transglycosylase-associated protein family)
MAELIPFLLIGWVVSIVAAGWAGSKNEGTLQGFILGIFLGPVGAIVAGLLDYRAMCRECHGRINGRPSVCPCCHAAEPWRGSLVVSMTNPPPAAPQPADVQEIAVGKVLRQGMGTAGRVLRAAVQAAQQQNPAKGPTDQNGGLR